MKKYDVVALGELLIDFTENGTSAQGNPLLEANPGGAPGNVLSMLQNLGRKTAFIGKVGNDAFGELLRETLKAQGIDVKNLCTDESVPTTLAFVHTKEGGDRSFSFYRNPGADMMLREEEVDAKLLKSTRIFHFGTLSMTDERIAAVTKSAVRQAKEAGVLISFDPNYRPLLWKDPEQAKEAMRFGIGQCEILKIADDEIFFLTGAETIDKGVGQIRKEFDVPLVCATLGIDGSIAYIGDHKVFCGPFLQENTIETTGAGDTFMACVLHTVLDKGLKDLTSEDLREMLSFANAAASIITTRRGALKVMPEKEEILALFSAGEKI